MVVSNEGDTHSTPKGKDENRFGRRGHLHSPAFGCSHLSSAGELVEEVETKTMADEMGGFPRTSFVVVLSY